MAHFNQIAMSIDLWKEVHYSVSGVKNYQKFIILSLEQMYSLKFDALIIDT